MRDSHNHSDVTVRVALGFAAAIALGAAGIGASGAAMSRTYVQDFETSTAGWFNNPPGTIHREPSGYVSPVAFASGVLSAHGNRHARLRTNSCDPTRFATTCFGPFTRWGKATSANPTFPNGGYMTEVDVYLDVQ